jgi:N-acetylglucosaminyldiphosphoundecaprenol N-acetyl-beta-D-mannosaminyltransferase
MVRNERETVFGLRFSGSGAEEILDAICGEPLAPGTGVRTLVTTNLDHVVSLVRNRTFRDAYARAWLTTIDGAPVMLYSKIQGIKVPRRITGADLFPQIMARLSPERHRPFFVAANRVTGDHIAQYLQARGFSPDRFRIAVPAFGFEQSEAESASLADTIRSFGTTHLFFGLGSPKSELWIDKNRTRLGDCYAFCFGAALDFFSGTARRAPRFMQSAGLEWAWRVALEPRRLFRRYFVHSWAFLYAIACDMRHGGYLNAAQRDAAAGAPDPSERKASAAQGASR